MRLKLLTTGMENVHEILDEKNTKKLLKSALPHQAEYIDKYDAGAYHFLLDELEEKLLAELKKAIDGSEIDQASIERADEIIGTIRQLEKDRAQQESANWELPHSSWAIPIITGFVVLLAVTSALA
jgi:hypothetical protein